MYPSMHPDYNATANHEIIARSKHFYADGLVSFRGSKAAVELRRIIWEEIGRVITFCSLDYVPEEEQEKSGVRKGRKTQKVDLSLCSIA